MSGGPSSPRQGGVAHRRIGAGYRVEVDARHGERRVRFPDALSRPSVGCAHRCATHGTSGGTTGNFCAWSRWRLRFICGSLGPACVLPRAPPYRKAGHVTNPTIWPEVTLDFVCSSARQLRCLVRRPTKAFGACVRVCRRRQPAHLHVGLARKRGSCGRPVCGSDIR